MLQSSARRFAASSRSMASQSRSSEKVPGSALRYSLIAFSIKAARLGSFDRAHTRKATKRTPSQGTRGSARADRPQLAKLADRQIEKGDIRHALVRTPNTRQRISISFMRAAGQWAACRCEMLLRASLGPPRYTFRPSSAEARAACPDASDVFSPEMALKPRRRQLSIANGMLDRLVAVLATVGQGSDRHIVTKDFGSPVVRPCADINGHKYCNDAVAQGG